ncbi:MAG TPA: serine/threonine-protein kinase [Pyrinomonadaceae bacterium]|jgi:serine/threonine-protein kinase
MRSEEWKKVEEVLDAALELEPRERRRFLDAACDGAPALRREVESLLACEGPADGFLDAPALAFSADFFDDDDAADGRAGQTVGRYRLIREIGRGGMGTVFLAERADGEFEQQVALKVVRRGFADTELARRFRHERRILASLNHPNIARLLDGGVSEEGEPFLAMEYVEGVRVDAYADARRLGTRERLELFRQVCAAVQYAHQNLVIHRDLKPSNILVTADGTPKLLDFGIAKLLDAEGDGAGAHTVTELGVMTPEYASPEQVRGESVTTASDVYSLGVVLYELLAGRRPYRVRSRKPGEAARAICEQEPERPSAASRTVETNGASSNVSRSNSSASNGSASNGSASTRPSVPPSQLRGDLDNIVLMAMRKEPARRYASVAQLSEDIRRHIDGLPVVARKDTFKYRAAKFVKRNKAAATAAALVVLTLVGGIVAVAWQARVAKEQARVAAQERDKARVEAAKAARINAFLQSIFASADPSWYSTGHGQRGEVKVVDVLEQTGRRIDEELKDEPEVRAELHHTLGTTYLALGRYDTAREHFRASLDAYLRLYGERHAKTAEALYYMGSSEISRDGAAANALLRQSLEVFRAVEPDNVNVDYLMQDFTATLLAAGETEEAERTALEGLERSRRRYGDVHALTAAFIAILGRINEYKGDLDRAEDFYRRALDSTRRIPNMQPSDLMEHLGHLAFHRGEFEQAASLYREALDISRRVRNETHPQHAHFLFRLAEAHYALGAYADAEREAADALDIQSRAGISVPGYRMRGLALLSLTHAKTRRPSRAAALLREALAQFDAAPDDLRYWDEGLLGEALIASNHEAEARTLLLKRHTHFASRFGEHNPEAARSRQLLDHLDDPPTRRP